MKLYFYNNGLFHNCPLLGDVLTNRYILNNDYFKCNTCSITFLTILSVGSELTHIAGSIYRIEQIESFNHDHFIDNNINAPYIEI